MTVSLIVIPGISAHDSSIQLFELYDSYSFRGNHFSNS